MMSLKKCIAIKTFAGGLLWVSLSAFLFAWAGQPVGTVKHLSGPLLAKKQDGTVKILAQKSEVEQGDTLISEKDTYASIKFIDNSEITLRPNSQLKIDSFSFAEKEPESDSAVFNLIKGGLRAVTGLLGKRSKERFGLNTPTAAIGIRGTIFIAEYVPVDQALLPSFGAPALPGLPGAGARAPGLYVQVLDGMIHLSNAGGAQSFTSGQFGYTSNLNQPPVVLPANPGIQFTPPPAFSVPNSPQAGSAEKPSNNVNCEVR